LCPPSGFPKGVSSTVRSHKRVLKTAQQMGSPNSLSEVGSLKWDRQVWFPKVPKGGSPKVAPKGVKQS
jgi:hypothetical protein